MYDSRFVAQEEALMTYAATIAEMTARALGLRLSPPLLLRADQVIE